MKDNDKITLSVGQIKRLIKESNKSESLSDIATEMTFNDSNLNMYVDRIDNIRLELNDLITTLKAMLVSRDPDKARMFEILHEISEKL
jgi:hypothetical protein